MEALLIHPTLVLVFNLLWLYQRKWEGLKEIYGFREEPYGSIQKALITTIWLYSLSGVLLVTLYLTLTLT